MASERRAYYGRILALIIATFAVGIALGGTRWGSFLYLLLQATTLLLALWTSDAGTKAKRWTVLSLSVLMVGGGLAALLGGDDTHAGTIGALGAILVVIALVAIGREIAKHPEVTGSTVMGALCIYLLIGLFFAYVELFIGAAGSEPFFAGHADASISDHIYFSYVTLTTVGFGDFVARGTVGRSVAVVEAIMGQLYLVTVVGFTVGNAAGNRARKAQERSEEDV